MPADASMRTNGSANASTIIRQSGWRRDASRAFGPFSAALRTPQRTRAGGEVDAEPGGDVGRSGGVVRDGSRAEPVLEALQPDLEDAQRGHASEVAVGRPGSDPDADDPAGRGLDGGS